MSNALDGRTTEQPFWRSTWTWLAIASLPLGAVFALLAGGDTWWLGIVLLGVVPAFVLLHRRPLVALAIWMVAAPLLVNLEGGGLGRRGYWIIHRALPVAVLAVVLLGGRIGVHRWRVNKLGFPEVLMAGYLGITLVSVWYTSLDPLANTYIVYDRILIPMCLYLLIRLLPPDESAMKMILSALAFLVVTQTLIGVLQWASPGLLPDAWLDRIGLRTTGSLRHPNAFGVSMLFGGVLLLNGGGRLRRMPQWVGVALFSIAVLMVMFTFSRASWLAGVFVLGGLLLLQPKLIGKLALAVTPIVLVLALSGVLFSAVDYAEARFASEGSEQSALSRLPVVVASLRMFEERPVFGWGYENFDRFDRQFQTSVLNLVTPEKDHASHNLYLTILAEQGLVGFALYIGPAIWWLALTPSAFRRMPKEGFFSRRLLVSLWLLVIAFLTVNSFSNITVVFAVGLWWVLLGLIGSVVTRFRPEKDWRGHELPPDKESLRDVLITETGMRADPGSA